MIFEVVDAHGIVNLLDADQHCIGNETDGPVVHDFTGVVMVRSGFGDATYPSHGPIGLRFIAPRSVREVP